MVSKVVATGLSLTALLALSACGNTWGDRALTGGAIGAASGAAMGAVLPGIGPAVGAAIGGGVGVATGALTTKDQIDIGDPIYR
ncbi:MAG: hypothetical protein IRY94_16410 [Rhodospirillaceae bacterium]|nr:hypothetical protein [Rhodospirillaceae bacterium]